MILRKITSETPRLEEETANIATLGSEIWHEHYTAIIGTEQVEYMLEKFQSATKIFTDIKQNNFTYFVAEKEGKMVAYSAIVPEGDCIMLSKLYVHKDARGLGLAKTFLNEVTSLHEGKKIRLTVNKYNTGALEAYKKLGFVIVEEFVNDIGGGFVMDDYAMERGC